MTCIRIRIPSNVIYELRIALTFENRMVRTNADDCNHLSRLECRESTLTMADSKQTQALRTSHLSTLEPTHAPLRRAQSSGGGGGGVGRGDLDYSRRFGQLVRQEPKVH